MKASVRCLNSLLMHQTFPRTLSSSLSQCRGQPGTHGELWGGPFESSAGWGTAVSHLLGYGWCVDGMQSQTGLFISATGTTGTTDLSQSHSEN